ncbi:hypothetical protein [Herbiconiux daphne]|nr:hypothetical protein [Herbiconiux daphne]
MPKKKAWGQHFLNEGKSYKSIKFEPQADDKKEMRKYGRQFKNF